MVIFDEIQKLLLCQKLNLGFECHVCKQKFFNSLEHLNHTRNCKSISEHLKCPKCGKTFGHRQILQLHMQFHNLNKTSPLSTESPVSSCQVKVECIDLTDSEDSHQESVYSGRTREENQTYFNTESLPDTKTTSAAVFEAFAVNETKAETNLSTPIKIFDSPKRQPGQYVKKKSKPAKKQVGLTKVKMEDCLRCDACSCIYIDKKDYYKHMRNFHQLDVNNVPIPQQKVKRKCRSCCKQCRGVHCTPVKRPRATQRASNLIFKINMRDNIKDRWTKMVSQQLNECPMIEPPSVQELVVDIKPDPDAITVKTEPELDPSIDLSHLLSQVEVKIKTEPSDDYFI